MEQVKSQVVGVILNGMRPELSPDFEDYKHYKYYYSVTGEKHCAGNAAPKEKTRPIPEEPSTTPRDKESNNLASRALGGRGETGTATAEAVSPGFPGEVHESAPEQEA
jgi:hypothetical protein